MTSPTVVVNLLGVGEGGEVTLSKMALRLMLEHNFDHPIDVVPLHAPHPGASLPSCIATAVRWRGVELNGRPVIIFSNMHETAWQNLKIRLGRLLPDVEFTRHNPIDFTGSEHMEYW